MREGEHWKVFLDWAVGFTIRFRAEVREQLPFAFSVEPESITLKPGETGSVTFRARNLSDATVKAKAGHLFEPPAAFLHTELVQCFCFFEDTYAPGEERELPVAIRLGWDIPPDIGEIAMVYEYFPLAQFQDRRPSRGRHLNRNGTAAGMTAIRRWRKRCACSAWCSATGSASPRHGASCAPPARVTPSSASTRTGCTARCAHSRSRCRGGCAPG